MYLYIFDSGVGLVRLCGVQLGRDSWKGIQTGKYPGLVLRED